MLAILIPYYKPDFFKSTLQSLANQSDKRFKVYIGDDCSYQDPLMLLALFKGEFEYDYHRFKNNIGSISLVEQWNRCIELVGSESWIMILGDDDVLGDNIVSTFYEKIEEIEINTNVVRFSTYKINNRGGLISSKYNHPKFENTIDFFFRGTRSSLSEYVFRKCQIDKIGFRNFPLAWFSDVLAVLEFSNFKNVYSINEAYVYIRISDISISGKKNNLREKNRATFEFYYYLVTNKLKYFSQKQRQILFYRLNKTYVNDKRNILFFIKISKFYFQNLMLDNYRIFLYLLIRNILKIK